jgi:hypothetical protein
VTVDCHTSQEDIVEDALTVVGGGHCAGQMRALQTFTSFFSNNKGGFYVQSTQVPEAVGGAPRLDP